MRTPEKPWQASPGVLVSGYADNGKLMLILVNNGRNSSVSVTLNKAELKKLGVEKLAFVNAENGKSVPVNGNKINIRLAAHDYMILWNL